MTINYDYIIKKIKSQSYNTDADFRSDVIAYIVSKIGKTKQAAAAYAKAWDDGHSSGYYDVLTYADELISILQIND